ncbi:MAG: DUF4132 domain-containing protein [Bradymonadia bacterium]
MTNPADLFPELTRLVSRYRDSYSLDDKIRDLCRERFDGKHSTLLWAAFRAGEVDLAREEHLYNVINDEPDAFDADDFVKWVLAMEACYPKAIKDHGSYTSRMAGSDDLDGDVYPISYLIQMKREDAAFAEAMGTRWSNLPEPWRTAVGWHLTRNGMLEWSALDEVTLYAVARQIVMHHTGQADGLPLDLLTPVMVKAADDVEVTSIEKPVLLGSMLPYTDTETLLRVAEKTQYSYYIWQGIEALDALPDDALPQLERAIAGLTIGPVESRKPWPAFLLIMTYLRRCQRDGQTPAATLDPQFEQFITHHHQNWGGSGEGEHRRAVRTCIAVIPPERLEALVLAPKETPWLFIGACNTPKVLKHITNTLCALPGRLDYDQKHLVETLVGTEYEKHTDGHLYDRLSDLVPNFNAALTAQRGSSATHSVMLTLLAKSGQAEAAEGVVAGLNSTSKTIREQAEGAIAHLPPESVTPHVIPLINSKRKDTRLAAALVLAGLPPTTEAYTTAQARLGKEKAAAVKAALALVRDPETESEGDAAVTEQIIEALFDSDGARWTEFRDQGSQLAHIYSQYLARAYKDSSITHYAQSSKHWLEVVKAFGDDPEVRRRALAIAPCYSHYGDDYLSALVEVCPAIKDEITPWALGGPLKRPLEFGRHRGEFDLAGVLAWARQYDFEAFVPLFIGALTDTRTKVRGPVIESLVHHIDEVLPALHTTLASTQDPLIQGALVQILSRTMLPSSLEPLRAFAARVGEDFPGLKSALAQVQAASIDIDAIADADLNATLEGLSAPEPPYGVELDTLPLAQWRSGEPLTRAAQAWLIGTVGQESLTRGSEALHALARRLDPVKAEALASALVDAHRFPYSGWPLFAQAIFGGVDRVAAIAGQLDELASSQRTKWGDEGVEALVRNGSDAAIRALDTAHRKTRRDALRWRSLAGLHRMADARGMTADDLVDSAMSACGFDGSGRQMLDYGPRAITLQLDEDLNIKIISNSGKVVKSLPAARTTDDVVKVQQAKAALSAIRKEMKQIQKVQPRRLEDALASQRTWPVADWRKRFVEHPLMRTLGRRLVWEAVHASGSSAGAFRVDRDEDGTHTTVDLKDNTFTLPEGGAVRLQHPIHLDAEQRDAWKDALWYAKERALFMQMDRRVFTPSDLPDDGELFTHLPRITAGQLMKGLNAQGYERGPREDAGAIHEASRTVGQYHITLHHDGYIPDLAGEEIELTGISLSHDDDTLQWREAPAVVFSEVALDIHVITGA